MRKTKWLVFVLIAVPLLGWIALLTQTLGDEPLKPEVSEISNAIYTPDSAALEGHKYVLGMFGPEDEDPAALGTRAYNAIKDSPATTPSEIAKLMRANREISRNDPCTKMVYCPRAYFDDPESRKKIDEGLRQHELLLKRYRHAVAHFPTFEGDLPTKVANDVNIPGLRSLARFELVEYSRLLNEKKSVEVARSLARANEFFALSIRYPLNLLHVLVALTVMKENRQFVTEALTEHPELSAALTPEMKKTFVLEGGFERLATNAANAELRVLANTLKNFSDEELYCGASLQDADRACEKRLDTWLNSKLAARLLKPNQTINAAYAESRSTINAHCVRNPEPCDSGPEKPSFSVGNFMGERLIFLLRLNSNGYKKIFESMRELSSAPQF